MKRISLRWKLIAALLCAGLIPLMASNVYTFFVSSTALESQAVDKLEAVRNVKGAAIQRYFQNIHDQILTFADDVAIQDAMGSFTQEFDQVIEANKFTKADLQEQRASVAEYYADQFGAKYVKETGSNINTAALLSQLSDDEIALQYLYISSNPNELGSKENMDRAKDYSKYSQVHEKYHPSIRKYLQKFGYYDIFLVDIDSGHIVYSVFKELDFATSLRSGPYSETNFARAFAAARKINDREKAVLVDYETYGPSYEAPASFIASPIWDGDKKIGVAMFQMPIDRLNAVMGERSGMGETGETIIVGPDRLMRSDSFLDPDNRSVQNSFKDPKSGSIDTDSVSAALKGEKGYSISKDYRGNQAIVAYAPLNILDQMTWALVAKIDEEEAFSSVSALTNAIFFMIVSSCALIAIFAYLLAGSISKRISFTASKLLAGADEVNNSSVSVASHGSKLSEASTEQAASLQETVTSIDEISSMVQRNAEAATNSTRVSSNSTETAKRGKKTVEEMISSINDISSSNEDIMTEMQRNNDEIAKIVHVISEIGNKTKVINDIVFQTKLLSFNASVEAARAGEHGKGFAVVAEEVGNLAAMSGTAALEITEMLDSSIKQVTDIVDTTKAKVDNLVKVSKDKVSVGTKTAHECGQALDEIINNVTSVNDMIKEIATASTEQSAGVKEVTKAMQQLDQTTHQNTVVAQQASSDADKLRTDASSLRSAVEELLAIVNGLGNQGQQHHTPIRAEEKPAEKAADNLVSLPASNSAPQLSEAKPALKPVTQLAEVPEPNDPRFEDL